MKAAGSRAALPLLLVGVFCGALASPARGQGGGEPPCPYSACDPCFSQSWTIRGGMVALERARPSGAVLVTDSFVGGAPLIDASDYQFGYEVGTDLWVIRHGAVVDLEFRWFQVNDWVATTPLFNSANGAVVHFLTPIGNTGLPSQVSSRYLSSLDSFELNVKLPLISWMSALAGFRYIQLDEQGLAITQDVGPGANTATYGIDASNNLYGFQLGLDGMLWDRGGPFQIAAFAKAGVYGDDARNRIRVNQTVGPAYASAAEESHAVFVGELGFTGVYQFNPHFSVRAGYQLTWIQGVALASDQIAVSDPFNGNGGIDLTGCPFYHGFTVAAEVRW